MKKALFIGLGHMGGALVSGIGKNPKANVELYGYNREIEKAKALARKIPQLQILKELHELESKEIDIIVIGVRPVDFDDLCKTLNKYNLQGKTIISMVNAVNLTEMKNQFKDQKDVSFVRIMPNMNASIQESVTAIAGLDIQPNELKFIKKMFENCGTVVGVSEAKFASFAAIAGCLPAYVFTFYKAVVEYAQSHGFNHKEAMEIVGQAITGSVHNAETSQDTLAKMIEQICVPNGSTIEGQKVLEANDFEGIIKRALKAANDKA